MGTDGVPPDMKPGDLCEIEISGIGVLRNRGGMMALALAPSVPRHETVVLDDDEAWPTPCPL